MPNALVMVRTPVGLADLPKLRGRVERIAPHVQGRQLRRLGHDIDATRETQTPR